MNKLQVERLGGFAGFGLPGSRLRSRGEVDLDLLSANDRRAVLQLFEHPPASPALPDAFRYRLQLDGKSPIEVPESLVPESVRDSVRDELN